MSQWKKYQSSHIVGEDRYSRQLKHALDIWVNKPGNSIIQIAKMVREYAKISGREIDFDESIAIAQRLSNGMHK